MDASPLIKAYDHARAAATADTTVAVNEHTLAAGEFASAAQHTSSIEALRTLRLLEAHHRRLAELLQRPPPEAATATTTTIVSEKEQGGDDGGENNKAPHKSSSSSHQMPPLPPTPASGRPAQQQAQQRHQSSREMSSSIASNLASARGIRSSSSSSSKKYRGQPLTPSVSVDQAPGNVDPHPRRDGSRTKMQTLMDQQQQQQYGKPTWVPPVPVPQSQSSPRSDMHQRRSSKSHHSVDSSSTDDGGYTRFYNTFGSLINKISAPLAFAGLPLIQEESMVIEKQTEQQQQQQEAIEEQQQPATPRRRSRTVPSPSAEPDLSKIYSKATMRALARQGHAPQESFYVVPSTGHTMSYANILSYAEKEKRRLESSVHDKTAATAVGRADDDDDGNDDDDDLVDARGELSVALLSSGARRRIGKASHVDSRQQQKQKQLSNTVEELYTENQSLKDMLDKLSRRLHTFEASAQQSSAMALAESYRLMRPLSPSSAAVVAVTTSASASVDDGTATATAAMMRRAQELEEQLSSTTKQMERLEKDNRKMQKTLDKYREKWELLKAGAKARRDGQKGPGETGEEEV